jgi:hypothetical protein
MLQIDSLLQYFAAENGRYHGMVKCYHAAAFQGVLGSGQVRGRIGFVLLLCGRPGNGNSPRIMALRRCAGSWAAMILPGPTIGEATKWHTSELRR